MRKLMQIMVVGTAILAMLSFGSVGPAIGQGRSVGSVPVVTSHGVRFRGTVNFAGLAARADAVGPAAVQLVGPRTTVGAASRASLAVGPPPNPPSTMVASGTGGAHGFVALSEAQQWAATGVDLEPPDQGLCAHGTKVMEPVNLALQVYTESGAALSPPVSLSALFELPPAYDASTKIFGPTLSDPRCYFDGQTGRWFVTVLEIDVNPYTGLPGYRSSELLAVSTTSNPLGSYGLFMIDSTDDGTDGTPVVANCPCFGDQPRIGADANGFYISADVFPIQGFSSEGGEIWAISKQGLAAAATKGPAFLPTLVTIYNGAIIIDGNPANAVQPAETPEGGTYAPNREYFLSTPDFSGSGFGVTGARAAVLWTLTNTASLNSYPPAVSLTDTLVPTEPFVPPVSAAQKPGPRPLGRSLGSPLTPIAVNDDRMQQVEYVGGQLYSSLNTGIGPGRTANRSGVAWFVITPHASAGTVAHQGYLAVGQGATLLYPAIGLTPAGSGVMTFSVSGPTQYPSHAYITFDPTGPSGPIYIDGLGSGPEDGFTCYYFGTPCRWGDYSAASADGQGHIVMGTELISNTARRPLANWGTFISVRAG